MNQGESSKSGRIAKNTLLLYVRMLILMVINLYTIRVVLLALGVEDYGIFSSVAGVVTILNSINSVMSNATQRFYSFYLGSRDSVGLNKVFSVSLDVYVLFVVLLFLLGETIGLWFVNTKLVIPVSRIVASNWTYQFSLLTFAITMLSMPFLSAILAHERIGAYSLFTTIEYVLKLVFALLLTKLKGDVLILYAATNFIAQLFLAICYHWYSRVNFSECVYHPFKKSGMHKEVISYSSWTLFGSIAGVGMNQVMTILYNVFFGPIVTASRAISLQISSALTAFSNSFITALRPPMIKSYSEGNNGYLMKLFSISNKFIFYSLLILAVPLVLEMDTVLKVWLKVEDCQTVNFSRLIILHFIILVLGNPVTIIIQAIGKVKEFYIKVELFTLLCPVLAYILFKSGFNPYFGYYAMILSMLLSHVMRLVCLKRLYPLFTYREYVLRFVVPALGIASIVLVASFFIHSLIDLAILRIISVTLTSLLLSLVLVCLFGITEDEKQVVLMFVKKVKERIIK